MQTVKKKITFSRAVCSFVHLDFKYRQRNMEKVQLASKTQKNSLRNYLMKRLKEQHLDVSLTSKKCLKGNFENIILGLKIEFRDNYSLN